MGQKRPCFLEESNSKKEGQSKRKDSLQGSLTEDEDKRPYVKISRRKGWILSYQEGQLLQVQSQAHSCKIGQIKELPTPLVGCW